MSSEGLRDRPRWGVVHVHTDHSDGGVDVPAVIESALAAELDFIVLTDHNTLEPRIYEGVHHGLSVLAEVEITPSPFRNHVIALGLPDLPDKFHQQKPSCFIDGVIQRGGFVWVPHPRGFWNPWCLAYNAPWKLWDSRIAGIELGTFLVEWVERIRPWNFWRAIRDPLAGVEGLDPRVVTQWDRLNVQHPVSGFLGIDAHYREKLRGRLRTPSYELLFRTNNLLVWAPPPTGDDRADLRNLRMALRRGDFVNVRTHVAGRGEIRFSRDETGLHVSAPTPGPTRVLVRRDGLIATEADGGTARIQHPSPGVYRAEVWVNGRLWALSNPLRVAPPPERPQPSRHSEELVVMPE